VIPTFDSYLRLQATHFAGHNAIHGPRTTDTSPLSPGLESDDIPVGEVKSRDQQRYRDDS